VPNLELLQAIQQFFVSHPLPPDSHPAAVLVAVSGGPDSVALLHALHQTGLPLQIQVAHLNHLIRGEKAATDAQYVAQFCQKLGMICHQAQYDVPAFAAAYKLSLEDAARRVRYTFLAHLLTRFQISLLLTGHNADDQAETLLLRILRGTGPHGLAGIAPMTSLPPPDSRLEATFGFDRAWLKQIRLGRPLLKVWRPEIEAYCAAHQLEPRHDETNTTPDYARNRIRLKLLPYLEKEYKPGLKINLGRLADLMRDEQALLDQLTETAFVEHAEIGPGKIEFKPEYFWGQPIALQRRLLRRAYSQLFGSLENLEAADTEALLLSPYSTTKVIVQLPGGLRGYASHKVIGLSLPPVPSLAPLKPELYPLLLIPPAILNPGWGWQIEAEIIKRTELEPDSFKSSGKYTAYLDYAQLGEQLLVRSRLPGDKFRPLGAPGRRKVQDLMLDAKIAPELRASWPLVLRLDKKENKVMEASEIVWLPGVAIADDFKITPQSQDLLILNFSSSGGVTNSGFAC